MQFRCNKLGISEEIFGFSFIREIGTVVQRDWKVVLSVNIFKTPALNKVSGEGGEGWGWLAFNFQIIFTIFVKFSFISRS
jgi:hypothetical protein